MEATGSVLGAGRELRKGRDRDPHGRHCGGRRPRTKCHWPTGTGEQHSHLGTPGLPGCCPCSLASRRDPRTLLSRVGEWAGSGPQEPHGLLNQAGAMAELRAPQGLEDGSADQGRGREDCLGRRKQESNHFQSLVEGEAHWGTSDLTPGSTGTAARQPQPCAVRWPHTLPQVSHRLLLKAHQAPPSAGPPTYNKHRCGPHEPQTHRSPPRSQHCLEPSLSRLPVCPAGAGGSPFQTPEGPGARGR